MSIFQVRWTNLGSSLLLFHIMIYVFGDIRILLSRTVFVLQFWSKISWSNGCSGLGFIVPYVSSWDATSILDARFQEMSVIACISYFANMYYDLQTLKGKIYLNRAFSLTPGRGCTLQTVVARLITLLYYEPVQADQNLTVLWAFLGCS